MKNTQTAHTMAASTAANPSSGRETLLLDQVRVAIVGSRLYSNSLVHKVP